MPASLTETVTFALFALMIGLVVFGGTTLTYFWGKRRPNPPNHVSVQRLHEPAKATRAAVPATGDNVNAPGDKAA